MSVQIRAFLIGCSALLISAALMMTCAVVVGRSLIACGASLTGHDLTTNAPDQCGNHLQCPKGCCSSASFDGEGWECVQPAEQRAGICVYVGNTPEIIEGRKTDDAGGDR